MSPEAHRSPAEHSCACDTDEHTLSVTVSCFHMLFGNFLWLENEILGGVLILGNLFSLGIVLKVVYIWVLLL